MIVTGSGIDIVYIPRIQNILQKYKEKFLAKVYSEKEITDSYRYSSCQMRVRHFAKRFAAKEAFVKALGSGFHRISMKDIEINNDKSGKPNIFVRKNTSNLLSESDIVQVSLSDDCNYAVAYVVIIQCKEIKLKSNNYL